MVVEKSRLVYQENELIMHYPERLASAFIIAPQEETREI
jgi:hypothetical protein